MRALLPAVMAALLALPAVAGMPRAAELDLGETVPGGDFRAYRVRLLEEAQVEVGGAFNSPGTGTEHHALPILAMVRGDAGWHMGLWSASDGTLFRQPAGYALLVRSPAFSQHSATPQTNYAVGGGWTTSPLAPGEYVLLVATAASHGSADLRIRVLGAAEVVAAQAGQVFYERGIDHSTVAVDAMAQVAGAAGHGRIWAYSGAALPLAVDGRMYGYAADSAGGAAWLDPQGETRRGAVVDGPGGAWTASFPAESHVGPVCAAFACAPDGARADPPFALAADVRV